MILPRNSVGPQELDGSDKAMQKMRGVIDTAAAAG
jgi:hypothetical protein